jgi:hypothetical protein
MTEPNQQLVEAVARAIADVAAWDADRQWPDWEGEARAAIKTVRATDGECQRLRSALEVIQAEARRQDVRLVHLKRCVASQCAALKEQSK